jgi:hypothetical protein
VIFAKILVRPGHRVLVLEVACPLNEIDFFLTFWAKTIDPVLLGDNRLQTLSIDFGIILYFLHKFHKA